MFRKGIDGVDVSAVSVHPTGKFIAASYRNGEVRVYRYPCQSQQVRYCTYTHRIWVTKIFNLFLHFLFLQGNFVALSGISSDATRLRFTADGAYLVITDSRTRSVLQYKVTVFSTAT